MASRAEAAARSKPSVVARKTRSTSAAAWSAWRIADGRFEPFSFVGASLVGGRWNSPGQGVIYASRTFAGAMLEALVHAGIGRLPRTQVSLEIRVPAVVALEEPNNLPTGWDRADLRASRAFGDAWLRAQRSAVLIVPSVVARKERNVLINPRHPDFKRITAAAPEPVIWDARLFGAS